MQEFLIGFQIKLYDYCLDSISALLHYPAHFVLRKVGRFQVLRNWVIQRRLQRQPTAAATASKPDLKQLTEQPPEQHHPPSQVKLTTGSIDRAHTTLQQTGLATGLQLSASLRQSLQAFAQETPCQGDRDPDCPFVYRHHDLAKTTYQRSFALANYPTVEQLPTLKNLRRDPLLLQIAENYLQVPPVYMGSELWWSFAEATDPLTQCKAAQVFHCDIDDYRAIRFFFYLSDVDAGSGPHVYIRGSHCRKNWLHQLAGTRATEAALRTFYGTDAITSIYGAAGTGFAEDSFGYHKGVPPTTTDRLMLVMLYTMQDYGSHPGLRPLRSRKPSAARPSVSSRLSTVSKPR